MAAATPELSLNAVVLAAIALLIQCGFMLVNRQTNVTRAKSNELDFQKAYLSLSEKDRVTATADRERMVRLEKQVDDLLDRNKEKDGQVASLSQKLESAGIQMAKDKTTIIELTTKFEEATKQLAELPLLREQMKALTAEVAQLRSEIALLKSQHVSELQARDKTIADLTLERDALKTERDELKVKLAAQSVATVATEAKA